MKPTKKKERKMTKNNKYIKKYTKALAISALSTVLLIGFQAQAAQQGHLRVSSNAEKMIIVNQGGKKAYKFIPAKKVLPGEIVQYKTYFENISNKPAENINIVNPIPKHTVYLPNSATGQNTFTVFSVDGGKHYGRAGTLKVRGRDGKFHPAKPSDYTHIRWQYKGRLAPKTKQAVSFRVRLR